MDEARVRRAVLAAVRDVLPAGADPAGRLALDSLGVVALIDALETRLDIRLRPEDVTADNFQSAEALVALCLRRS